MSREVATDAWQLADIPDQAGRTVVVTGPSVGGLGHATALERAKESTASAAARTKRARAARAGSGAGSAQASAPGRSRSSGAKGDKTGPCAPKSARVSSGPRWRQRSAMVWKTSASGASGAPCASPTPAEVHSPPSTVS